MKAETYPFVVRPLPCEYREPSPYISAETLLYHHDRIYKNDIDLLNQALSDYPVLQKRSLRELLAAPENLPVSLQIPVKRYGGSAFNHELYFDSLQPACREQDPKGVMLEALIRDFGAVRDFREELKKAAMSRFGAGYAWLVLDYEGRLRILTTANQNTPDLKKMIPLLNVDVWEHAYYLQYQDRREEYISAWLKLINWRKTACRYEDAMAEAENYRKLHGADEAAADLTAPRVEICGEEMPGLIQKERCGEISG